MLNSKAHPEEQVEAFQTTNGDQYDDYDDGHNYIDSYDDQGDPFANQGCDNDIGNTGGGSSGNGGNGGDTTDTIGNDDTLDGANANDDEGNGRRKRSATGVTR